MREIKYRAYHKKKECLVDVLRICFINGTVTVPIETDDTDDYWWHSTICNLEDVELMQFTGLTDKNGREIYEGDIITTDIDSIKGTLIYRYGCFQVKYDHEKYESLINIAYPEVIGNMYENPELLKENEK